MQTVASSQEQDEETTVKTTRLPNAEFEKLENADWYEDCWEKATLKHKEKQGTTGAKQTRDEHGAQQWKTRKHGA